jgi:hypothetical protein
MSVTFRYADLAEYPQISRFLNDYWAADHVYCRQEDLYRWAFGRGTPRVGPNEGGPSTMAVAENQGELVGILGGMPFVFNQFGESKRGVWITNYVVRPDHRKGSTALQLLSMFRGNSGRGEHDYDITVAFGIKPATATIYKVLRGEVLADIPRQLLVFPGASERMAHILALAHPEWEESRRQSLAAAFEMREMPMVSDIVLDQFDLADWDERNWAILARETVGAARDASFLQWRYFDHPLFSYRTVTVREGSRTGLAIWRMETIHRLVDGAREPVDRIARLVEFLPASDENAKELFAGVLLQAKQAGAFAVDYYGYHGRYGRLLEASGLQRVSQVEDGEWIPTRFQPLDGKGGGIMSAMLVQFATPACAADVACPWYWTKADSDQDRPN